MASALARLVQLGRVEVILAGAMAVFSLAVHLAVVGQPQALALDMCAYAAAAAAGRFPRAGGTGLAAVLALYLFAPSDWQTLGEYASFIPILGAGMRSDNRACAILTLGYLPLVGALTWLDAPRPTSAVLGWLFWVVAFAAMWFLGAVFARTLAAQRQAHLAFLLKQRQAVARELHDTVAASLTRLVMSTEAAILRQSVSTAELRAIADSAAASVKDLRLIVGLLRDPVDGRDIRLHRPTELAVTLGFAEQELGRHGYAVTLEVAGDVSLIDAASGAALSAATVEAVNNILKHGDKSGPSAILVNVGEAAAEVLFMNRRTEASRANPHRSAYGLTGLRERLAEVGGEVFVENNIDQWLTRLVVPLEGGNWRRDTCA